MLRWKGERERNNTQLKMKEIKSFYFLNLFDFVGISSILVVLPIAAVPQRLCFPAPSNKLYGRIKKEGKKEK